jgi:hypothetical protein
VRARIGGELDVARLECEPQGGGALGGQAAVALDAGAQALEAGDERLVDAVLVALEGLRQIALAASSRALWA